MSRMDGVQCPEQTEWNRNGRSGVEWMEWNRNERSGVEWTEWNKNGMVESGRGGKNVGNIGNIGKHWKTSEVDLMKYGI